MNNASLEVALRELSEISAVSPLVFRSRKDEMDYTQSRGERFSNCEKRGNRWGERARELASKGLVSPRFIEITYRAPGRWKEIGARTIPLNLLRQPPFSPLITRVYRIAQFTIHYGTLHCSWLASKKRKSYVVPPRFPSPHLSITFLTTKLSI